MLKLIPQVLQFLVRATLLFGVLACSVQDSKVQSTATTSKTVFAVLIPKLVGEQPGITVYRPAQYFNRLAGMTTNLYVLPEGEAKRAKSFATATVALPGSNSDDLYIVEVDDSETLPHEFARLGQFALIRVPRNETAHSVLGTHRLYARKINKVLQSHVSVSKSLISLSLGSAEPVKSFTIADLNTEQMRHDLEVLSGEKSFDLDGKSITITERRSSKNKAYARAYLKRRLEAQGYKVREAAYGLRDVMASGNDSSFAGGVNFVAEKAGADERYFLVTAHLDSVGNAGADDDASGVVSALAIADTLSSETLQTGVRFVFFDEEELGLVGSAAYVRQLSKDGRLGEVLGVLNLEMTGYDSDQDGAFHAIDCNENSSAQLTSKFLAVVEAGDYNLKHSKACTNRSDHASFWKVGLPAIVVSEDFFGGDGNPCYHARCDKIDRLNFTYFHSLSAALVTFAASIVL